MFASSVFPTLVGAVRAPVGDTEIAALREALWAQSKIGSGDMTALFAAKDRLGSLDPLFSEFLQEAVLHFALKQDWPRNFLSDANATLLIDLIAKDGRIDAEAEYELLVRLAEQAEQCPASFKAFLCKEIEVAVLTGKGITRQGTTLAPRVVDAADVAYLRRLVFAPGAGGSLKVNFEEAEMLFRIKDATLGAPNDPVWQSLFVQAIANHLMAYLNYTPRTIEDAARQDAFIADNAPKAGRFLGQMVNSFGSSAFTKLFSKEASADHAGQIASDLAITIEESAWLKRQIAHDGKTDDLEKALLTFLVDECAPLGNNALPFDVATTLSA